MAAKNSIVLTDADREILDGLADFLPDRVFDAHAHLWRVKDCRFPPGCEVAQASDGTIESWRESQERIFGPGRVWGGLFLGEPRSNPDSANDFLVKQLKDVPGSRAAILITPDYPRERAVEYLDSGLVAGFKPYHLFSREQPTFSSSIAGYLPEGAWELADTHRLVIVLHLVRDLALSDPGNQREIREKCERYPGAAVILAHAGRGFHAPNTVRGIAALRGLDNVFFDTSAVCESAALVAVLDEFGPRKLLWGSDYWISEMRGRAVTIGDGFAWLTDQTVRWESVSPACRPVLVGIESLRALRDAAGMVGLDRTDRDDIFYANAVHLLGIAKRDSKEGQNLYKKAKEIIPGGAQLLSKRPEMQAPGLWPAYFREARGSEVWDFDGRRFYDMSGSGIGSCLLGYRDPDVTEAVRRRLNFGSMSQLNPPEDVALAELLLELHPWAERVRYARSGGEAMAVAVRIARATTDRSAVAICGYSGWHDWYLAANLGADDALRGHLLPGLQPLGVPRELRGTALPFRYDREDEFREIVESRGKDLAAVVMEPCRYQDPKPGFLEEIVDRAHSAGALVIFDEITIGWRLICGGAHLIFSVTPDIAVFAKAIGNGHPMAAVIGTAAAMEGAHTSFISSTYWTESIGPAAALATIRKMRGIDVPGHVERIGRRAMEIWRKYGLKHSLPIEVDEGYPCLAHFRFDHQEANELRTYYTQLMLERGFLAGTQFYPSLTHSEDILTKFERAADAVFGEIAEAFQKGDVQKRLKGPPAHTGFTRLI
jgi:glutamate-1-semialdehyde 2,1-aminomutase